MYRIGNDPSNSNEEERRELSEEKRQQAFIDYFKLAHDTHKHLATLNAGSIVLIGTFLKDIFPKGKSGQYLDVGPITKILIAASFVCFAVSLAASAYLLTRYARSALGTALNEYRQGRLSFLTSNLREVAVYSFPLGLVCFGAAVLATAVF